MLICHCKGLNHRDLERALALGARNVADLDRLCGAGGACGGCRPALESLLPARHERRESRIEIRGER